MAKVTSKLQLTVPKAIADQYRIRPGDELEWVPAGDTIRVTPLRRHQRSSGVLTPKEKLKLFDRSTERQKQRELGHPATNRAKNNDRGWKREDLYFRGSVD